MTSSDHRLAPRRRLHAPANPNHALPQKPAKRKSSGHELLASVQVIPLPPLPIAAHLPLQPPRYCGQAHGTPILRRARQPLRLFSTNLSPQSFPAPAPGSTPVSRSCASSKRSMETAAAVSKSCASSFAAASVARTGPANVLLPFLRRARQPLPFFCTGMICPKIQSGKLRTSNFCTRRVKAASSKCNLSHVLPLAAVILF